MKRYMFRGKRKDNSEWVYGYYISSPEFPFNDCKHFITEFIGIESGEPIFAWIEVIPETVGQFTNQELGLYVGDIVNYVTGNPKRYVNAVVEFGEYETYTHYNKEEGDVEKHVGFYINDGESKFPLGSLWIEKIGNIHDNPELLNPAKGAVTNTMQDPAAKQEATNEQVTELESAAQDQAMEVDSEEGTTEG